MPAGEAQEDVVQGRLGDGEAAEGEARVVDPAHECRDELGRGRGVDAYLFAGDLALWSEVGEQACGPLRLARVTELQLDDLVADPAFELARRPLGDDPTAVDDGDAVGEAVGLLEVLRCEEDGDTALAVEPPDLLPDGHSAHRVQARRGLVEEEDEGVVDQRQGEVEPALHAAGVLADALLRLDVGEVDGHEEALGDTLRLGPRGSEEARLQDEQLARRHERVEADLLQRDADRRPDLVTLVPDVVAGDQRLPRRRLEYGRQHLDDGGLAGAVGPEEPEDGAALDAKVDVVDGAQAAEVAAQRDRRDAAVDLTVLGRHLVLTVRHAVSFDLGPPGLPERSPAVVRAKLTQGIQVAEASPWVYPRQRSPWVVNEGAVKTWIGRVVGVVV